MSFHASRLVQRLHTLCRGQRARSVPRQTAAPARQRNRRFEQLETRTVLSATFGSALSAGNVAYDVATDSGGNSYVTGYFSGTVDFDLSRAMPGGADTLTARGSGDAYLAKYAPDNALLWVRRMGGDVETGLVVADAGRSVAVDASGNVYVVGEFLATADFGSTTLVSAGGRDGFVAKFNANGALTWAKRWGTTAEDYGSGVGVDSSGNVYAQSHRIQKGHDLLKFKSNGALAWSFEVANTSAAGSSDIAVSAKGDVYMVGRFQGTVDFDPSTKVKNVSSGPSMAGFVLKVDTNGKFGWATPFVGRTVGSTSGYSFAQRVALDPSGNVIVGGLYNGSVDFDPGSAVVTLPGAQGAFLAKLNSSGGLVWTRALEATSTTFVYGLTTDAAGSIYATGTSFGTIDLNPGAAVVTPESAGSTDIFVVKLTASGGYAWGETFGGAGGDIGWGIAVDRTGVVHLAGSISGQVDFDPDPLAVYALGSPGTAKSGFRLRLNQS